MTFKRIQCGECKCLFNEEQIILTHYEGWDMSLIALCEKCWQLKNPSLVIKSKKEVENV